MNQEIIRDVNDDRSRTGQSEEELLSPCPCGEKAAYYRAVPPVAGTTPVRGKPVSAMVPADFHENLCAECFKAAFGAESCEGWVRA